MPDPTDPSDLPTELPLLLAMAYRHFIERLHEQLREEGREPLRPAHGYVFRFLSMSGGATAQAVAAHLEVTKQAASQLVTELEDWGYVKRTADPSDGRAWIVTLTRKGSEYVRHVTGIYSAIEADWVALIGADRVEQVRADLGALVLSSYDGKVPKLRPSW